jgi:hypothetical protein
MLELIETASTTRAKRRQPLAATASFQLQMLLVGEDVEVGEGIGLGSDRGSPCASGEQTR